MNPTTLSLLFLIGCYGSVVAQDLDSLIDSVFNVKNNTVNKNPEVNLQPSPSPSPEQGGCTCVAYYLCNNGTINKDGTGIIDIRYVIKKKCNS